MSAFVALKLIPAQEAEAIGGGRGFYAKGKALADTARVLKAHYPELQGRLPVDEAYLDQAIEAGISMRDLGSDILVEGNDERGIDVGVLSKLPIGEINSYQRERHDKLPGEPVYRRDLLLVEVLSPDRRKRLLWVGVTHFKSQFIDWRIKDEAERQKAAEEASRLRLYEAEMTANILRSSTNEERFVLCGDLNDVPDSEALTPLLGRHGRQAGLVNVLAERQGNELERWTVTHKETGEERQFDQYDYLLVPEFMSDAVTKAWVQRRSTGHCEPDGSDRDPVFCELAL